jgi:tetratricopeptide (TPR) repeat protein
MPGRSSAQMPAQRPATRLTPAGGVPVVQQAPVDLAAIEDLLQKQQWEPARKQLNALIAKDPKPRYKALLQYSFGREAQLARKVDEARDKLLDALEIDSELLIAQKALAELHTRRK